MVTVEAVAAAVTVEAVEAAVMAAAVTVEAVEAAVIFLEPRVD